MNNLKREFGEIFFYIVFTIWLSSEVLLNSTIKKVFIWDAKDVNDVIAYLVLILLLVQIVLFQQYTRQEIITIVIMTLPIAYATINSNHNTMMSTWVFIVASKNMDFDRLVNLAYVVQIIMIGTVFYLFFSGYITEYTTYRGALLRHSLGFSHPNLLGFRVFQLVISRCYIRRNKINFIDVLLTLLAAYFINTIANSKTSYYSLIILAVMMLIHIVTNMMEGGSNGVLVYGIAVAIVSNIASVFLSIIDVRKNTVLNFIDSVMSRRFYMCYRTMKYYGITLWGQDVQLIVKRHIVGDVHHFWLDNAYMALLLRYGVVVYLLFSTIYIGAMAYIRNAKLYVLLEIMCLYAIYGIMENNFFSMSQNIFLLTLSYPIYKRQLAEDHIMPSRIRIRA